MGSDLAVLSWSAGNKYTAISFFRKYCWKQECVDKISAEDNDLKCSGTLILFPLQKMFKVFSCYVIVQDVILHGALNLCG